MAKTGFTPGPWSRNIKPARKYPTVFAGRNKHICYVATAADLSDEEIEANLDLIHAVPALYKAVELALRNAESSLAFLPVKSSNIEKRMIESQIEIYSYALNTAKGQK